MAEINWRAVGIGFVVTLVIGLIGGFTVSMTDLTIPIIGWGLTGLVGGAAAGYVAGHGVDNGIVNGILGTTIGAIVVLGALLIAGTLLFGLVGLSVFLVPILLLGLYAIPGAVGGAIGAMLKGTESAEAGQPAGR